MGAPRIKRDLRKHERETLRRMGTQRYTAVAIIQDKDGKILSVGVDHGSAYMGLSDEDKAKANFEIKEFRLWR